MTARMPGTAPSGPADPPQARPATAARTSAPGLSARIRSFAHAVQRPIIM
jgi:hypothetical protein